MPVTKFEVSAKAPKSDEVKAWLEKLVSAEKLEKEWRKEGEKLCKLYESKDLEPSSFNILYSNTETMSPSLYNNTPRVVVQHRFKEGSPAEQAAAKVCKRYLEFQLDPNNAKYASFDDLMEKSVLNVLVPGRASIEFAYEADQPDPTKPPTYETVCGKPVRWNRILYGYSDSWEATPWLAFEHWMTETEVASTYPDLKDKLPPTEVTMMLDENEKEKSVVAEDAKDAAKLVHIFVIWDKVTKKVLHLCPDYPKMLKTLDDPYGLEGFFPTPKPLILYSKVNGVAPVALYEAYRQQAEELNEVSYRITLVVKAIRVRGFYDADIEGLNKLFDSSDNTLLPAENVAALQDRGSLEKAIWLFPLEKLVTVLNQLYLQREQLKKTIFEIVGMSDILRGSSAASETASAQQIKDKWGSLRLKRGQKKVAQFARDSLRLLAELSFKRLSPQTILQMVGMRFPTTEEKQRAQAQFQQLEMQVAQAQQMQQQVPPEVQKQGMQLKQMLSQPALEEIFEILKNDLRRNYTIDIETNTTVDVEATEDKEQIGEFLNALAQFLNGVAPLIERGYMPFAAAKEMMVAVSRRFRFGDEVEAQLQAMQEPQKSQVDPKEIEKKEKELEGQMQKLRDEGAGLEQQKRELELQAKENEDEKQFALKELEQAKKMAVNEIRFERKINDQQLKQATEFAAGQINLQERSAQERVGMKSQAVEAKEKQLTEGIGKIPQPPAVEEIVTGVVEALNPMFQALQQSIESSARVKKRAVKQPDGSWATVFED